MRPKIAMWSDYGAPRHKHWRSPSRRSRGSSIGPKILVAAVVVVAGVIGISGIYPQVIDSEWVQGPSPRSQRVAQSEPTPTPTTRRSGIVAENSVTSAPYPGDDRRGCRTASGPCRGGNARACTGCGGCCRPGCAGAYCCGACSSGCAACRAGSGFPAGSAGAPPVGCRCRTAGRRYGCRARHCRRRRPGQGRSAGRTCRRRSRCSGSRRAPGLCQQSAGEAAARCRTASLARLLRRLRPVWRVRRLPVLRHALIGDCIRRVFAG